MKNIGKKLKIARKNMGFSQKELADASKVVQSSIAQFETNVRVPPDETLAKICQALNVTTEWVKEEDAEILDLQAENDVFMSSGQRLKSRLDLIKMSADRLAFFTGISEETINDYLNETQHMNVLHCKVIAITIGVKPAWLAFGD